MRINQKGFGAVEGLLIIIALTLIVGVGFYVVNANKDDNKGNSNSTSESTQQSTKKTDTKATVTEQPQKSDEELIKEAVRADASGAELSVLEVDTITGTNAKGHAGGESTGGFSFIAVKNGDDWTVVHKGQQMPGKDIGQKYNLPADWYSTDY